MLLVLGHLLSSVASIFFLYLIICMFISKCVMRNTYAFTNLSTYVHKFISTYDMMYVHFIFFFLNIFLFLLAILPLHALFNDIFEKNKCFPKLANVWKGRAKWKKPYWWTFLLCFLIFKYSRWSLVYTILISTYVFQYFSTSQIFAQ